MHRLCSFTIAAWCNRYCCTAGVPKLKRAELESACEDFSNIIGSLSDGTVYKGTLSSGIEIAVVASSVKSSQDWSRNLESQFRKKVLIVFTYQCACSFLEVFKTHPIIQYLSDLVTICN